MGVIFRLMKKKVLEKLDTVSWISPDTKQAAIDKIQKLDGKFLGSEIFFNYTLLQQRYRGVTVFIEQDFVKKLMKIALSSLFDLWLIS